MPVQYTAIFHGCKNVNFHLKKYDFFLHIFAQNKDCWYSLEPPHLGRSNVYPQSMFWAKKKKNDLKNYLKINIFTAVKYCCILHGRVCVMISEFFTGF